MSDSTGIQESQSPRECQWPHESVVYLTVDYECDYGTALSENTFEALNETSWLVALLEDLDIPLTCFIQTEVLETKPAEVDRLRNSTQSVTFHPHSHTHKRREHTDVETELETATQTYEDFFGYSPVGYRFPNGNVRPTDYVALAEHGYQFDASVFPFWRPNHFNNTDAATQPQYFPDYDLFEIPFTVYSNRVRIPTALSYCRLIGRSYTELLVRRPPPVIIFNIHLHDLTNPPAYSELSPFYRGVYKRNADAKPLLKQTLTRFQQNGYEFRQLDELYADLRSE